MLDYRAICLGLQRCVQDCVARVRVEDDGEHLVGVRYAHRPHRPMLQGVFEADLLEAAENLRNVEEGNRGASWQREVVLLLPAGVCERDFVQFWVPVDAAVTLNKQKNLHQFTPMFWEAPDARMSKPSSPMSHLSPSTSTIRLSWRPPPHSSASFSIMCIVGQLFK